MSRPLKGFITYAHKNTAAKDELITRLAVMQQQNKLVTWHDAEMTGGTKWREDIFKHLADSDILLYLVSAASLASKNCNKELAEAVSFQHKDYPDNPCSIVIGRIISSATSKLFLTKAILLTNGNLRARLAKCGGQYPKSR